MVINGHLTFHTVGDGELKNAVIERLAGGASGAGSTPCLKVSAWTSGS